MRVRIVLGVLCEIGAAVAWFGYHHLTATIVLIVLGLVFLVGASVLDAVLEGIN